MLASPTLAEISNPEPLSLVHLVEPLEMDFHFKISFSGIPIGCDTPANELKIRLYTRQKKHSF